jgi:hypothetical protein
VWRGAGAVHAGFVPALVHLGNVWLAEEMTGHLGYEKHDPGGQRLVLRKTMTGGQGPVPGPGPIGSRSVQRGRVVTWIRDLN